MLLKQYEQGAAAFKVTLNDRDYLVIVDAHDPAMILGAARQLWVEEYLEYADVNSLEYRKTVNQLVEQSKLLVLDKIENLHLAGYYAVPDKPAARKMARKPKAKQAKKPGRKKQAAAPKKRTISAEGRKAMSDAAKRRVATRKALQQRVEQEQARQAYIPSANNAKTIRELNRIQTPPSADTPIEEGEGA